MTNQELFFLIFGLLCAVSGYFANRINLLITGLIEIKRRQKVYPYIEFAHKDGICKGLHVWREATLALGPVTGKHDVCAECGFVSGFDGNYKLNAPALEVFKAYLKKQFDRKILQERAFARKQSESTEIMNELIRTHAGKLSEDLGKNIEVMQQFFRKSNIELDSLYTDLSKILSDESNG